MKRSTHKLLPLLALAVFSGCASNASREALRDPAFAPVQPVVTQAPQAATGSIFRPGGNMLLFGDRKALRVGDLLTVMLVEKTDASKSASTATDRSTAIEMSAPTLLGVPVLLGGNQVLQNSVAAGSSFAGDGQSNQSNSLSGSITVTVSEVMPNGNLRVRGEKLLSLNQGDEFIRLTGIVRADDISPDNTVESTKLADTYISYGGSGVIADANSKGWLSRFFDVVWPF